MSLEDRTATPRANTYDAIVIGAGHNGMALATYLGKSGWSVLCLEARYEEGGGLSTEEYTEPSFLHNMHSNYHSFVGLCPVYDDLELIGGDGASYVHPPVQAGSIFKDGTAITIHTDMKKTHASMARFSLKDADTFERLYKEVKGFQDLMIKTLMFGPPLDLNDITRALAAWKVEEKTEFFRGENRSLTINDFLNKYFENEKIKTMLAFHAHVCGYYTDVKGLATSFPFMLGKIDNWHICLGGSHRLAHSLWRQMRRNNAVLIPARPVKDIILQGGRAVGVRCQNGEEFYATKLVASSVDPNQTFQKMLPASAVPKDVMTEVENYKYQEGSLYTVHMALHRIPTYKAAAFDPDINKAWVVNMGYETLEDFNQDWQDIRNQKAPDNPKLTWSCNSLYDPYDAPAGKATGLIRVIAPFELEGKGAGMWRTGFEEVYHKRCVAQLMEYVDESSFTRDDIIQTRSYTPVDTADKLVNMVRGDWMVGRLDHSNLLANRPCKQLSQYRTPIEGLYLCGSCTHPHGYITFGPAYNALQSIAEDFGMEKWWEQI
ncbi:MAG: NAD(P)/FAD-dependent oxidoreductase [Deltaproteobacteria bacterium]|nr:NAD(P)/FAD-dependent oxidoreductase [Deltaproteobacteria bacterium]